MTTRPTRVPDPLRKLTPRESQALAHLAAGHGLDDTAAALGVTPATARSYLHRALRKLGCPTEAAAIALLTTAPPVSPRPPADPTGPDRTRVAPTAPGERSGTTQTPSAPAEPGTGGAPSRAADPGPGHPSGDRSPRPHRGSGTPEPGPAAAPVNGERRRPDGRPSPGKQQAAPGQDAPADSTDRRAAPVPAPVPAPGKRERDAPSAPTDRDGRQRKAPSAPAAGPATPARSRSGWDAPTAPGKPAPAPAVREPDVPATVKSTDPRERIRQALTEAGNGRNLTEDFEELYEGAHTRLVQQVFLLTACRHRAVHYVRLAFGEARRDWGGVVGSGDPEGWVRMRACELALSPWRRGGPRRVHTWTLPHRRIRVRPADEAQSVLPDHDRLTDRDRALLKALRRLSRPQRRALVLHDGVGMPAAAVAVEVESTLAAAEGRVWAARAALAQWVPELVGTDPAAPGFADGLSRLLHRAAVRGCPEPHRAPLPVLRARHRLWTASRTGAAVLLTAAVGGATLATLAGLRPVALFHRPDEPAPVLCVPAPAAKVPVPGVPLLPGGAPNGITSLWCSPTPGLEAVVADRQPQAIARWQLPAAVRGAAPPPQQGPAACPAWSPLPCAPAGPRR
ncbi:sigma factor-like helix-turn-helix DNA-binding protein [Kitasatospora sp. NPDC017646]|uniref:sigma factor-like helix-turn-helix DNA-binding protein n=1 Tax=Kitasatospora sp. NPDC017646 TaxID=3364024 RepID=UPI00379E5A86